MRQLSNKRGQVQSIAPAVLILTFAAIVLVFGLIITQEVRDTDVISNALSYTITDETLTTVNEKGEQVVNAGGGCFFNGFAVVTAMNASDGYLINSANYTVTSDGFVNFTGGAINVNNTDWVINYTYTNGGITCNSANATVVGLGTFADFWQIIVLAIVITVVIGLLLTVFGGRRQR